MNIFHKITLANLKKNRTRTLVTIIGIVLSTAMFVAVTTCVSSLQNFLLEYTVYNHGSWHGSAQHMTQQETEEFLALDEVDQHVTLRALGFAELPESQNDYKPYLFLCGVDDSITNLLPVHILEGRMPENDSEILLPEHLATNGLVKYELGDTLTLEAGTRIDSEGYELDNHAPLTVSDSPSLSDSADASGSDASDALVPAEHIADATTRTYQVVGFYERPVFEDYTAPGYTALTYAPDAVCTYQDVYVTTGLGTDIQSFLSDNAPSSFSINYSYLRLLGASGESSYNRVLYSLAAILIGIIVFGSISLIYNAFSISISERTRQFGLLSSIGATRRQLIRSVLFEAAFLCIIGIPLGIASGLLGIGITLHFTGHTIAGIFAGGNQAIFLTLHPSVGAIVIAVLLAFCTVLLSAFLPAKRAMKLSAIDAIRQTTDVSIRPGKVKISRLTEKLFGFEGMLASKNYKRSRKRYRATVISLFLSVVLFIPASSFSAYLTASANRFYKDSEYDITVSLYDAADREAASQLLSAIPEVTRYGYSAMATIQFTVGNEYLNDSYVKTEKLLHEEAATAADDSAHTYNGTLLFIPDDVFRDYLNDNSLEPADYFDTGAPRAILNDQLHKYSSDTKKYYDYSMLKNPTDADVQLAFYEYLSSENMYAQDPELVPITIGAVLTDLPYGVRSNDYSIQLLYPYSMMDALLTSLDAEKDYDSLTGLPLSEYMAPDFMIRCSDHKAAYEKIKKQMEEQDISVYVYDHAESAEESRAMLTVVNIFSYGFIILISLIAVANIFNTISTNLSLRRREFAMLKSVGLSPRGMRKMMQFECLLYGFRGLLYGLPVSIFVTWLIYRSVSAGLELDFFVPWYSVCIAVGSVFLVVAITMVYSMRRLNRENTVDALKNENL